MVLFVAFTLNNRPPNVNVPSPVRPVDNAYNDFVRASSMVGMIAHKSPASMVSAPTTRAGYLAQTKACMEDSAAGLVVQRSGLKKPCAAIAVRSAQDGRMAMKSYDGFRELARTISGVGIYYELSGQIRKWADVLLDGEEMAVMIPNGGGLFADLVGIACEHISLSRFEQVIPLLSADDLAHVGRRLDVIQAKRASYSDILVEDGYTTASETMELLKDPKKQTLSARWEFFKSSLRNPNGTNPSAADVKDALSEAFRNKTVMIKDELDTFKQVAAEARKPYTTNPKFASPNNSLATLIPVLVQGRAKHLGMESIINLLRIQVALYRFKVERGHFPNQLSELSPTYLSTVPLDPFTGTSNKPYQYSLSSNTSFSLYGVGPDKIDHGGQFGKNAGDVGFDIVAGHISRTRKLFQ